MDDDAYGCCGQALTRFTGYPSGGPDRPPQPLAAGMVAACPPTGTLANMGMDSAGTQSSSRQGPTPPIVGDQAGSAFLLTAIRILYLGLMIAAASIPIIGAGPGGSDLIDFVVPVSTTLMVAVIVVLLDIRTPNKRISNVVGVYLAIVSGLFAALAVGVLIDLIAEAWELTTEDSALKYLTLLKLAVGLTLCYVAVSVVLSTRDSIRMLIPYVEFNRQVRGIRPLLLDTSSLIDGRLNALSQTGFLDAPIIIPQFVVDEAHRLSDSSDKLKRERGRRGLANLRLLQEQSSSPVQIEPIEVLSGTDVDTSLIELAGEKNLRIVTTDTNLSRVAEIRGVQSLNLHELGAVTAAPAVPGEMITLEIIRAGDGPGQGVGFLPDGTMVVIEAGASAIGQSLTVTITNSVQTSAGRIVFARLDHKDPSADSHSLRDAATSGQHRHRGPGPNAD